MKAHLTNKPADFCTHVGNKSTIRFLGNDTFLYQGIPRKKPCPCGSGKKYKHCCAGKENNDGRTER